ncbi:MAG: isoprenylcysteine carboxylmethyltransferase family protein [Vicinamibacteria bacterium]|jgi:protein-S-isoprenylcysteine O-methyltransferase Ste14|nr:isoprenylcysteine carboxylmethyltransferase family protein [Vicinamibacteria bacterium]
MSVSRYRVPCGFLLGVALLLLARATPATLAIGMPIVVLGECVRVWAAGHIDKTRALATGGPYAHSRNPLYLGSSLMALGVVVAASSVWVAACVCLYFVVFYPFVIREEARFLAGKFGEQYAAWAQAVPLFFPRVAPAGPCATRFSWARVMANREWRAMLAVPCVALLLYAHFWVRTIWHL